ncbi:MAG: hypothetical protein WDN03_14375 [Rhizomicrobium sp.]
MALALFVAGCAAKPPDLEPVTMIAARSCDTRPALANAVAVAPDPDKPANALIDAQARCLDGAGGKALYALFALPDGAPYTVSVSSVPMGRSTFAPRAILLDSAGNVMRELPDGSFLFRGANLTALFRAHPGERYMAVASDTHLVGRPISRLQENTQVRGAAAGGFYFEIHTGSEQTHDSTWSHNGQIVVAVTPDKKER